ncbi:RNA polymerase sigma factor SigY [Mesobacillus harenae]|uniref:RNA polymerase sigma factor SigY n=1 Tax=Mesobacillus harenae TaxID=2213203 RepID=UPI0015807DA9|nr:RNA polymerase sigma factor SigY [Mesobacillus harenae]
MDEKKLIDSAKKGDERAFAALFQENYPFLVKYLIKITMNSHIAEEIAQGTMAKCVEKIHLYNGNAKFSSWLISIATNLYIDQLRKQKHEQNWQKDESARRKLQWQLESRKEEWTDALTALGKLAPAARVSIVLKHYYGYSYDEIGRFLNISPGTVKSRVHHGLLTVRKELAADGGSEKISSRRPAGK